MKVLIIFFVTFQKTDRTVTYSTKKEKTDAAVRRRSTEKLFQKKSSDLQESNYNMDSYF